MTAGPTTDSVTFIVSQVHPRYGIEAAAANLIETLSAVRPVRVIALGGAVPERIGAAPVTVHGTHRTGLRRALNIFTLRGVGGDGPIVLVGAWVAVPWLLANIGRDTSRVVVWEHSFTEGRVASDKRVGQLWHLARRQYRRAQLIVSPGRATTELLAQTFDRPIITAPNVTDIAMPVTSTERRSGVVCIGRLEPVKRVDLALRTYALADLDEPLTIIGDGSERAALEALADSLGVSDKVTFTGMLSREETLALLASSRALLHTAAHETFGLVYLEAAALEVPVVSTGHPTARDLIPALVPGVIAGTDERDLAWALRYVMQTADHWDWGLALTSRAIRFSTDATVRLWDSTLDVLS